MQLLRRGGDAAAASSSGGSALLLRLFESSFFNVHLAAEYLKTYPNSIGITHYLIRRLRSFDAAEVEFYWPQLCYLVITLPTQSVALENFILERCEQDPHIAVITLWYLQSSLSDLFSKPTSDAFSICRRIYNRVQSIIFTDPPVPSTSTFSPSSLSLRMKEKINAPTASFVGMGIIGAAFGMPKLAEVCGQVAIEQGRRLVEMDTLTVENGQVVDGERSPSGSESGSASEEDVVGSGKGTSAGGKASAPTTPKKKSLKAKALSRIAPNRSQTEPEIEALSYLPGPRLEASLPSTPISTPKRQEPQEVSYLPFTTPSPPSTTPSSPSLSYSQQQKRRLHPNGTATPQTPPRHRGPANLKGNPTSLSVPSLPTAHSATYLGPNSSQSSLTGTTLPGYGLPKPFLSHLLLLQSSRTQLDLIRSLQDISTRLVIVPKLARLSSLRAELTVLNHGLPRGCCLGMSCHGTPFPSGPPGNVKKCRAHHRIVRISPSESVVLNSADRAPFVIHVEVLEGDLDFDPDRRQNAEDLRRALQERETGMSSIGRPINGSASPNPAARKSMESGMDYGRTPDAGTPMKRDRSVTESVIGVNPMGLNSPAMRSVGDLSNARVDPGDLGGPLSDEPEMEMDMVEQLYGEVSIRDPSLLEPVTPPDSPIQNRSVDEQAWARKSADGGHEGKSEVGAGESAGASGSGTPAVARPGGRSVSTRPAISLDDYAERMRMAAIMLAQLDASQTASLGVVATGTAAAGTLVGLPVAVVGGVGGVVGAGLGAVASRLARRDVQPGQASTGVSAALDTTSAASGTSSISGAPPLPATPNPAIPAIVTPNSPLPPSAPQPPAQRHRVLAPVEATAIRNRIMGEMMALEEERMERMRADGRARSGWAGASAVDDAVVKRAVSKDDPSGAVFAESFAAKTARIRAASPYGHLATWNVISVIVKTGADLRQEQLAIQIIKVMGQIWKEENCPSWVRYFRILVTSETSGLIETITDSVSIHSIKKNAFARTDAEGNPLVASYNLYDYFVETYGPPDSAPYRRAQDAFLKSLASYSVICYLLQLKDRHNGNILVDREGHLIHIDFGFMFSNSPGSLGFEMAPFKLPQDYIDILGGFESEKFGEFKALFKRAFRDTRKHAERIITLVELMQKDSSLPCFQNGDLTSQQLRERFALSLTQSQVDDFAEKLIINSAQSTFTRLYDLFQGYSNGIL